jgi:hypothetical protein
MGNLVIKSSAPDLLDFIKKEIKTWDDIFKKINGQRQNASLDRLFFDAFDGTEERWNNIRKQMVKYCTRIAYDIGYNILIDCFDLIYLMWC